MTAYREWVEASHRLAGSVVGPSSAVAVMPVAAPVPAPVLAGEALDEYTRVATELGFAPVALQREKVRGWFSDEGMRVYDRKQVSAFLTSQYGQSSRPVADMGTWGATWCWRPMRQRDRRPEERPVIRPTQVVSVSSGAFMFGDPSPVWTAGPSANNAIADWLAPYQKAIPLPVLLTAKRVCDQFPEARLFVSDEVRETEKPRDPFLMVVIDGLDFIIERWDEPNYRER